MSKLKLKLALLLCPWLADAWDKELLR